MPIIMPVRLVLTFCLLCAPFAWAVGTSRVATPKETFQMRLTLTFFQGVLADYFAEYEADLINKQIGERSLFQRLTNPRVDTVKLDYFANKSYLQTFLQTWSNDIDSGQFHSSAEIIQNIRARNGYLSKYFSKWESVLSPLHAKGKINLGGYHEQFLSLVLGSETSPSTVAQRLQAIIKEANVIYVTMGEKYDLALRIAQPFLDANDAGLRNEAKGLIDTIPLQKRLKIFTVDESAAVGAVFLKAFKVIRIGAAVFLVRTAAKFKKAKVVQVIPTPYKPANPFQRGPLLKWSAVVASGTLHAGVLAGATVEQMKSTNTPVSEATSPVVVPAIKFTHIPVAVSNLWEAFYQAYPKSFPLTGLTDFTPNFKLKPIGLTLAKIKAHLSEGIPLDYGDTFLQVEKHFAVDQADREDNFLMDFVKNRYDVLRNQVHSIAMNAALDPTAKMEAIRKVVIGQAVGNYKRDYPNMVSLLANWGGNCVSDTMLFTSLLLPYEYHLPGKPVVYLTSKHMESGLYKHPDLMLMLQGTNGPPDATLHRPEYLMRLVLRNFPEAMRGFKDFDTKINPSSEMGLISSKGKKSQADQAKDKRAGILETNAPADLDSHGGGEGDDGEGDGTPYSGRQPYGKMSRHRKSTGKANVVPDKSGDQEEADGDDEDEYDGSGDSNNQIQHPGGNSGDSQGLGGSGDSGSGGSKSGASGSKAPKRPRLTFHVVLDNTQDFKILKYSRVNNQDSTTITAYDEVTYQDLVAVLHQPKMKDKKFSEFLAKYPDFDLDPLFAMEEFKRVFEVPHQGAKANATDFSPLLKMSKDDLWKLAKLKPELSLIEPSIDSKNPSWIDAFQSLSVNFNNGHRNVPQSQAYAAQFLDLKSNEINLITKFSRKPGEFLKVYNVAPLALRENLVHRFFGSDFATYALGGDKAQADQVFARGKLREFMSRLGAIKVIYDQEEFWICDKVAIDLPQVKYWPPEWQQYPNVKCGPTETPPKEVVMANASNKDFDGKDLLELKVSTLIELTLMTQRGLQVWNENVVDAFVYGHHGVIGIPRPAAVKILKSLVQQDQRFRVNPKFAPILSLPDALTPADSDDSKNSKSSVSGGHSG